MNYPTAIVVAGGLALALVAVPVQFESGDLLPSKSIALADKGGNPNGGNSRDHSNAGGGGNGSSTGRGWAFGAGGHTSHIFGHPGNSSSIASRLKGLNAAHASPDALANAATRSFSASASAMTSNALAGMPAPPASSNAAWAASRAAVRSARSCGVVAIPRYAASKPIRELGAGLANVSGEAWAALRPFSRLAMLELLPG